MISINETLKVLPPEARQEVIDFAEFLVQKYLPEQPKMKSVEHGIMNFAGCWEDMEEEDFQSFINGVYERREKSSRREREI